jgi:hypothetical protein
MKKIVMSSVMVLAFGSSLYAGGDLGTTEPVIDTPTVEVENEPRAYNLGLKFGTLGLGLDLSTPVTEALSVRFNVNGLTYSDTQEIDDVNYDGDLDLLTVGALLDYYPTSTNFRLSGGVYYNDNKFSGTAVPTATTVVELNGVDYGVDDIGRVDSEVTFNTFAPYLGLGWGNRVEESGWGFSLDVGAMYHGEPESKIDVVINNPTIEQQIRDDVEAEKRSAQEDISDYKFYPVVMVGVNYSF